MSDRQRPDARGGDGLERLLRELTREGLVPFPVTPAMAKDVVWSSVPLTASAEELRLHVLRQEARAAAVTRELGVSCPGPLVIFRPELARQFSSRRSLVPLVSGRVSAEGELPLGPPNLEGYGLFPGSSLRAKHVLLEVRDEGLAPLMRPGDHLLVDPQATLLGPGMCGVVRGPDGFAVPRIVRWGGDASRRGGDEPVGRFNEPGEQPLGHVVGWWSGGEE